MALTRLVIGLPLHCRCSGNGVPKEPRRALAWGAAVSIDRKGGGALLVELSASDAKRCSGRREPRPRASMRESAHNCSTLEIPVTCYQILGVSEKAEKDEVVKAVMELKNSRIEEGYTGELSASRQDLLMDVRDKLLFEPEYAGNIKDNVQPRSSLHIPWSWLPAALCVLQEVGEEKLVLQIGRANRHHPNSQPYLHDLLLSMALAECSIAKNSFEKNKVSQGFEALAHAQHLLRSKTSLEKMPLLEQIEGSLQELVPTCTLEHLSMPHTPDDAERRQRAIAALRELIRQGLAVESSCRVQDWHCFFSQAMSKLMANEIVGLLSWDALATSRRNKKSLESQNQRAVVDFNCFYIAMMAHIAFGFSTRQMEMISKAKTICECLIASDSVDLKLEESFCSFLLGQESDKVAIEKLRQLDVKGRSDSQNLGLTRCKEENSKGTSCVSLELWLKDAVLSRFLDTWDCSPSLANFFVGPKRVSSSLKQKLGMAGTLSFAGNQSTSYAFLPDNKGSGEQTPHASNIKHLGEAVKQLAPASLDAQSALDKPTNSTSTSVPLRRDDILHHVRAWEAWSMTGNTCEKFASSILVGGVLLGTFKLLTLQIGHAKFTDNSLIGHPKMAAAAAAVSMNCPSGSEEFSAAVISNSMWRKLGKLLVLIRPNNKSSSLSAAMGTPESTLCKQKMAPEEAEALVKQWQDFKAEALGPGHQIQVLSMVLDDPMLSKWTVLANSAKAQSCFWRFVLLKLSILRAEIISDEVGCQVAEIEAVLEEAAELVDESQPKKPSYYSTYKVQYTLKRQDDSSWRFCDGAIQSSA